MSNLVDSSPASCIGATSVGLEQVGNRVKIVCSGVAPPPSCTPVVNGGWSGWVYGPCSGSTRQRDRFCNNPSKSCGGADCVGVNSETVSIGCGAVNCVGSWGACSGPNKTYTITTPASGGGTACPYANGAVQACACHANGTIVDIGGYSCTTKAASDCCSYPLNTCTNGTGTYSWGKCGQTTASCAMLPACI